MNTEMGIIGVLPLVAEHFHVSISQAGLLVSLFALAVAISGPTLPLLFSGINRKQVMLLALGVFLIGNTVSIFTSNFTIAIIARVVPAFFHPIYVSLAFTVAAASSIRKKLLKLFPRCLSAYQQVWCWECRSAALLPVQLPWEWRCYSLRL